MTTQPFASPAFTGSASDQAPSAAPCCTQNNWMHTVFYIQPDCQTSERRRGSLQKPTQSPTSKLVFRCRAKRLYH